MSSLKEHQAAMVTLLANGNALPASASRLAHAMHDVLALLNDRPEATVAHTERRSDSTTSGLNDAMLALDVAAVKPKTPTAQQIIKQRENTIRQLKNRVAMLKSHNENLESQMNAVLALQKEPEQAGCRKEDTDNGCPHPWTMESYTLGGKVIQERCGCCGAVVSERPQEEPL